jgi:hypothetical protein
MFTLELFDEYIFVDAALPERFGSVMNIPIVTFSEREKSTSLENGHIKILNRKQHSVTGSKSYFIHKKGNK